MSKTPKDLFQRYVTPPSRLHNAVQSLARQEGWIPPWDREEQQSQKKAAGKKSGIIRESRTNLRRYIVGAAHWGLMPAYRNQPYSTTSIGVLREDYLKILHYEPNNSLDVMCLQLAKKQNPSGDPVFRFCLSLLIQMPKLPENDRQMLEKISKETLIKDLKAIGVRSKRSKKRSG
jgi:hypothetical protein